MFKRGEETMRGEVGRGEDMGEESREKRIGGGEEQRGEEM